MDINNSEIADDGDIEAIIRKYYYRSKDLYTNYQASDIVYPLNVELARLVSSYNPSSVLDFGCGTGKHFWLIDASEHLGIDWSQDNVDVARSRSLNVIQGDERLLERMTKQYDVVFTCSALCHVPKIEEIVTNMKRIASKAIIVAETNDISANTVYYPHDYEALGFQQTPYSYRSHKRWGGNDALYRIWICEHKDGKRDKDS